MKKSLIFAALVAASLIPLACRKNTPPPAPHASHVEQAVADVYTCPMHPQIEAHAPGKCPICGMTLVKRGGTPASPASSNVGAVALSPEQRVTGSGGYFGNRRSVNDSSHRLNTDPRPVRTTR